MSLVPDSVIASLQAGGVIAYPTSTLPGLATLPNPEALDALYNLKQRPAHQPVSLGVHSLEQAEAFVVVPPIAHELLAAFPRGSLTLLLDAQHPVDPRLGGERIAVRVLEHPTARALVAHVGPVTATSANTSGEPPLESAEAAGIGLGLSPNSILSGACPGGLGSTFVSLIEDEDQPSGYSVSIMREGVAHANEVKTWMLMRV